MQQVTYGIDVFLQDPEVNKNSRFAIVTNNAAFTSARILSRLALVEKGFNLIKIFSPEHGISVKGADGLSQKDSIDIKTALPIISLYGDRLIPTEEDLKDIDIVLFDIPDVGCRFYTYIATMGNCLEAAANSIDFDAIGGRNTAVFGVKLNLEVLGRSGEIAIAVPQSAIAPLRQAFSRTSSKDALRPDPRWAQQIEREITKASVTLRAVLDERPMRLGEISHLRVGQVLELKATPRTRVNLECDGERLILCQFGKSNGVYTLRVDEFVDREQEFMNDILSG